MCDNPGMRASWCLVAALVLAACGDDSGGGADAAAGTDASADAGPTPDGGAPGPMGLHASGNQILDGLGNPVHIHGVNRSGSEYACIQGWGLFDGPVDAAAAQAIAAWHANTVRVPLNEDCWLGLHTMPGLGGADYQAAIAADVDTLTAAGLYVILELHWTAPGDMTADGQDPLPDRDHTPLFWSQVATAYKDKADHVVLELFNEPFPDGNQDTEKAWTCWRDGGDCGDGYLAAGMQELVDSVRGTGAKNLVLLGGVQYSHSLDGWIAHAPIDPAGNLAVAWHVYNFNLCTNAACWDAKVGPVAAQVPVVATEIGEDDANGAFISAVMDWLDASGGVGYLAWTWDTWNDPLALITDYAGTAHGVYGQTYKDRLASF
jgi:hypothetical protein